jgi:phosphoserine phosphatase
MAADDASLREQQPYKAAYEGDQHWMGTALVKHYQGDDADLALLLQAVQTAFTGMTVAEYDAKVREFFRSADHPTLNRPYQGMGFAPMVELLRYLEANGFLNFIASGGDRDFMRPIVPELYQIPPERVIGSALGMTYEESDDGPHLRYGGEMAYFDDGPEKPVRIWSRIGRRPLIAVGNSNGDIPMLQIAGAPEGRPGLQLFVLHDDAEREFDYVAGAEKLIALAQTKGWHAISIRNDWNKIFAA